MTDDTTPIQNDDAAEQPQRRVRYPLVAGFLSAVVVVITAMTAARFVGSWHWSLDLFSHFVHVYALVCGVLAVAMLALRCRVFAVIALAIALTNAWPVAALNIEPAGANMHGKGSLQIALINVHTNNPNKQAVIDWVESSAADFVILQEVDQHWLRALRDGLRVFRVDVGMPRSDNFGMVLLVRNTDVSHLTYNARLAEPEAVGTGLPVILLDVTFSSTQSPPRTIHIMAMHPLPPVGAAYTAERDEQLRVAGQWAAQNKPCVIVGDLNTTPWSYVFDLVQSPGNLLNSQQGYGIAPTFPSGGRAWPVIPIDHLLHSDDLVTIDRRVGPHVGSDHRPLLVELNWRERK